jgi:murein DD-endopeptidase MepM/ murein hydrolase activator NlpD
MTNEDGAAGNGRFKKLAAQWLNQVRFSNQIFVLVDSFVLRNHQLLVAAKRQPQCTNTVSDIFLETTISPAMFKKIKTKITTSGLLLLFVFSFTSYAQNNQTQSIDEGGEYPIEINDINNPCITTEQYEITEQQCAANIKMLGLENVGQRSVKITSFIWPLRIANGLNDCSYYTIANYVDQDTTSPGFRDWNCGRVTYDGHRGTDIDTWPYPFYKLDNNQVEVIAAAAGTIIFKADGGFDKNCASNNLPSNHIVLQHADGSLTFYHHMKMNSLTNKTVGQTVVSGEFLGIVASSGDATGPHLHFEIYYANVNNATNDPYNGPCNILNANSWWAIQKPYTEPAIIKTQVNIINTVLPACPATETPNEDSCFTGGTSAKFYIFTRNETIGLVQNMRIVNPDGTTFSSWTHTSTSNYLASYRIFTQALPTTVGIYTFEAVYNGDTCSKSFMIDCNITGLSGVKSALAISAYPNPFSFATTLQADKPFNEATLTVYNSLGQHVKKIININGQSITIHRDNLSSGLYYLQLTQGNQTIATDKLVITDN